MKRYGTLDEQAAAICFLASDEASYITGTVLPGRRWRPGLTPTSHYACDGDHRGHDCVGRDRELAELARRAARDRRPAAALSWPSSAGPASAKALLLRRLVEQHGGTAFWAQAATWESETPGAVLRQLLQDDVPSEPAAAATHFVEQFLRRAAPEEPAIVVIDDAEHADPVSLQRADHGRCGSTATCHC